MNKDEWDEFEDDQWDEDEYELVTDPKEREEILKKQSPIVTSVEGKPKKDASHLKQYQFKPGNQMSRKPKRKSFKKVAEEIWQLALTPNALSDDNKQLKEYIEQRVQRAKRDGQRYITLKQAMIFAQMYKAVNGDTQAFNAVCDRVEGKPVQMNLNANKDFSYVDFINEINGVDDEDD